MARSPALLIACVGAVGCGGGGGEPLVSGTITGQFADHDFTIASGFATLYDGEPIIGLGEDVDCGSPAAADPPDGYSALLRPPAFDVGSYSNVGIDFVHASSTDFSFVGSSDASLNITAATADTIAGSVSYSYTDTDGAAYHLNGTFEVVHCP